MNNKLNDIDQTIKKFDYVFSLKNDGYTFLRAPLHTLFSDREIDTLKRTEMNFKPQNRQIVFLSFENRFATLGGLAAVTKFLPKMIQKKNEKIVFISPYHQGSTAVKKAFDAGLFKVIFTNVVFHLCDYEGIVSCFQDTSSDIPSYFIKIEGCFCAGDNPYGYDDQSKLLFDSCAFAAAVPFVMNKLGFTQNLIFHAHDWETALISITSKLAVVSNVLQQARSILTLHNSFDSALSSELKRKFFSKNIPGETVLQCSIPFLNGPLTTVSTPFALELVHDPFQNKIFTNHLQTHFMKNPPVGIENGIFGDLQDSFLASLPKNSTSGIEDSILTQKKIYRKKFIELLNNYNDPSSMGKVQFSKSDTNVPIFFMSGRLDFMQKGFDIMLNAFSQLKRGSAKLVMCPNSSQNRTVETEQFFQYFIDKCAGDLAIFPVRISPENYEIFLKGSSYLLMPSLYEPFGAASEGLINGTPVIVRGTGGLWVQVRPFTQVSIPTFYKSILAFNNMHDSANGIIFREEITSFENEDSLWKELLEIKPIERPKNIIFKSMISAAYDALKTAVKLYHEPALYCSLIKNGLVTLESLSWQRAVDKYKKVYDTTCFRGM